MPKNVVHRLYLDKGLLNEGDDLLLVGVGGCRKRKEALSRNYRDAKLHLEGFAHANADAKFLKIPYNFVRAKV